MDVTYCGPCNVDCNLKCPVPAGFILHEVPVPRHAWPDVVVCPNGTEEGLAGPCGRAFMGRRSVFPVVPQPSPEVVTGHCPYCGGMTYKDRIGEWRHVYPPCNEGK